VTCSAKEKEENTNIFAKADITLDHMTISYADKLAPALKDINLTIPHGASIGIIGTSGAGKSTLINIILGLLTPDIGHVSANGMAITDHLRNWQNHIGYVPQSIYLLDDTLRRNIAFGLEDNDINEEKVKRASKQAQLDALIKSLPNGLDTVIGEDGGRLSGGEKQRIALARALYRDPSILILDEATSSLDPNTERDVMAVVSGAYWGMLDTIDHGVTGLLGKTALDLENNIIHFLQNPQKANMFGEWGIEFVTQRYSWEHVIKNWQSLLQTIQQERPLKRIAFKTNYAQHYKWMIALNRFIQRIIGRSLFWPSLIEIRNFLYPIIQNLKSKITKK